MFAALFGSNPFSFYFCSIGPKILQVMLIELEFLTDIMIRSFTQSVAGAQTGGAVRTRST